MTVGGPEICDDLARQLAFLAEIEKLKGVVRATPIYDASRRENSAEHSWTLALYALILSGEAGAGVDPMRAVKMLLLHDLVEIDVGDVPIHSATAQLDGALIAAKELAAAERIFGLLPQAQGAEMLALWQEFEAAQTPTAIYAKSLDRVQPVLLNLQAGGGSWTDYHVTLPQLEARVGEKVARGLPRVWARVRALVAPWFAQNARES